MLGRNRPQTAAQPRRCPDCSGALRMVRRCPYLAMRCEACGKVHEFKDVAAQMDDPFEDEMGWVPLDRL